MREPVLRVFLLFLCAAACSVQTSFAQTTQGLISGQLVDSVTGRPVTAANVFYSSAISNLAGASSSDASGYYYLPLLSPGTYQIRVTSPMYQAQEVQELELTVAARIELDFRLRPLSDVWNPANTRAFFSRDKRPSFRFMVPTSTPANPVRLKRKKEGASRWNPPFRK